MGGASVPGRVALSRAIPSSRMARPPARNPAPPDGAGWRPFQPGDGGGVALPFARFARAHALLGAGDTLVALALAGSLFFSISPDAARGRVALYLVLTMAPFAVVAPLIGPFLV